MTDRNFSMGTSYTAGGDGRTPPKGDGATPPAGDIVKDSDTAHFVADVIEASRQTPVIVDFWAEWCGPCKQLGPVIEKVVREAGGKVRLVKVDVDSNQALAQQMRVQSIPMVYAFVDGQPVDGFAGALPEGRLREFVNKVAAMGGPGKAAREYLERAEEAMKKEDWMQAMGFYAQAIQKAPDNMKAVAGLIRAHIGKGDLDGAAQVLATVPEERRADPDIASAAAALEMAQNPVDEAALENLSAKVEADPDDFDARFELARALNVAGKREEAMEQLLHILRKDREWNDEAARKELLKFFEAWGPTDPLTLKGRRRLSSVLFS